MKKLIIIAILIFNLSNTFAQYYVFDSIPENLKKRADAVVRSEQCIYTVKKPGNAVKKIKKVITLLNESSDFYRYLTVGYNKFTRINYLKGKIYNKKGVLVEVLDESDVYDMATMSDFYSDERIKVMHFPVYKYPYTIEYEYEITYSSLMNYPEWEFQDFPDVSVQRSGVQFIIPSNMKIRLHEKYLKSSVDSAIINGSKIYTWQEENIPAFHSGDLLKQVYHSPVIQTAPLDFEYGGVKGSMRSWKDFGAWVYAVNKDRDKLTEANMAEISDLVKDVTSQTDKIRKVYEYVQARTRYVSIQIGIGGYQTAEASDVAKFGYGDCKALVNYTHSLLKVIGIDSFFALVNSSTYDDIDKDFVNNQFNHVILCVPSQKDSIWLECTSNTLPAGYLVEGTTGKNVLLLTPDGGKLVKSPDFRKETNKFFRSATLFMNVYGVVSGKLSNIYNGSYFGDANRRYSFESSEDLSRYLHSSLRFGEMTVSSVNYSEQKNSHPWGKLDYDVTIKNFGTQNGQRIYFSPGIAIQKYVQKSPYEITIPTNETISDSLVLYLPLNFNVEYLPENVKIESDFGIFTCKLNIDRDRLTYLRTLELNKSEIDSENYESFRNFINSIADIDRRKIILQRITGS